MNLTSFVPRLSYLDKVNPPSPLRHALGYPYFQALEQVTLTGPRHAVINDGHVGGASSESR